MASPSLSTGYSGSESLDSVSNSADSDFTENLVDSMTHPSFISSLVSHCVSMRSVSPRDNQPAGSEMPAKVPEANEQAELREAAGEESNIEAEQVTLKDSSNPDSLNSGSKIQKPKKSEQRKTSEIIIIPEVNSDFNVSESCLQLSVEFTDSDSESETETETDSTNPTSSRDQDEKDFGAKKKESFISEIEFRPKTEYLLEIAPAEAQQIISGDKEDDTGADGGHEDPDRADQSEIPDHSEAQRGSENHSEHFVEVKSITINEDETVEQASAITKPVVSGSSEDLAGLTKWSSQQRLIIVVDEKDEAMSASATNITTDVLTSKTIISITTSPMSRYYYALKRALDFSHCLIREHRDWNVFGGV